jgi:hypothetical protein
MASSEVQMFTIYSKDFDELYDLAESIIATKTNATKSGKVVDTNESLAAKALQFQIDTAKENKTEFLIFSEQEVSFLSAVVS